MGLIGKMKQGAALLSDHPALVGWFVRNKLRTATLSLERNHMEGVSRFARGVTFRLTNACNLRCKMCRFVESGDVESSIHESLPLDAWIDLIDDLAQFRPYITLTGGEPLIYPNIGEIVRRIVKHNMRCTITTNGTLLARCASDLMQAPPDIVVVSVDGPPEVHNEVRGQPGAFEKAAEGIAAIHEARKEQGVKNPLLAINCAITSYSYKSVDEMIGIACDLGVDALNFQHQWSITSKMVEEHNRLHGSMHRVSCDELGAVDPEPVDLDEMVDVVQRIRSGARKVDKLIVTMHPELNEEELRAWYADPHAWVQRRPASCAWINTDVSPTGDVEPCYGVVCGNVTKEKLSKIWNNRPYRQYRRRLSVSEDFPICVRCCAYFRRD